MQPFLVVIAEILGLLKIWRQGKKTENEIKQKEIFVERAKNQQRVEQKDADEKLISEVIHAPNEVEKQKKLDEIRKVISK